MTVKKTILLTLLVIFFADSIDAQRTRTRTRTDNVDVPVSQKLAFSANMGNLGFAGGGFSFSLKGMAGYKFAEPITAGIQAKFFYDVQSAAGPDISLFSYGTGLFGRLTIAQQFFIQGEYNITSYDNEPALSGIDRETYTYPMVGGGYESGYGPWTYGIMLLFNLNEEVREFGVVGFGEYWITFSYNF